MSELLMLLIIINYIGVVLFLIYKLIRKQPVTMILFFIFLPILGFVMYGIIAFFLACSKSYHYDKASLVRRFQLEKEQNHPYMTEEMNVVPVADAVAISNLHEKRSLVLDQLRKDISINYRFVLDAENDSDSESAHYVAAAKMEVCSRLRKKWEEVLERYQESPESDIFFHQMMKTLAEFIGSQVLSQKEQVLYMMQYCELFLSQYDGDPSRLSVEEQNNYIYYLVASGRKEEAISAFYTKVEKKGEMAYFQILSVLYDQKRKEEFYQCIEELEQDNSIRLSSEGVEKLRLWRERKNDHAVI